MKLFFAIGMLCLLAVGCSEAPLNKTFNEPLARAMPSPGEIHNKAMSYGKAAFETNPGFTTADDAVAGINNYLNNYVITTFGVYGESASSYKAFSSQTAESLKGLPRGWQRAMRSELGQLASAGAISMAEHDLMEVLVDHMKTDMPNSRKQLAMDAVVIDFDGLSPVDQTDIGSAIFSIAEYSTSWWMDDTDDETIDVGEFVLADVAGAIHGAVVALGVDLLDGDGEIDWGNVLDAAVSGAISASFGIVVGWISSF